MGTRFRRFIAACAFGGALCLLISTLGPSRAEALVNDGSGCNDSTITWHFDNNPYPWTSEKRTWVRAAINSIETALDYDGSKLVDIVETADSGIAVRLDDAALSSGYGLAVCPLAGAYMWLSRHATTATFQYKVARHEMMHLIGADHSGRGDSFDGAEDPSTMSTCVTASQFNPANVLDRDAETDLNFHHSSLSYSQLTANIGFEDGTSAWGGTNGGLIANSSGGAVGPKHVAFAAEGTSSNSYIRQTVRVWTGDDNDVKIRAVVSARTNASVETNARAAVYRIGMFEGDSSNGCPYERGLRDPNDRSLWGSTWVKVTETPLTGVGASWGSLTTPWTRLPYPADGWQLQFRAYGNAADASYVRFDNARIDEQ